MHLPNLPLLFLERQVFCPSRLCYAGDIPMWFHVQTMVCMFPYKCGIAYSTLACSKALILKISLRNMTSFHSHFVFVVVKGWACSCTSFHLQSCCKYLYYSQHCSSFLRITFLVTAYRIFKQCIHSETFWVMVKSISYQIQILVEHVHFQRL